MKAMVKGICNGEEFRYIEYNIINVVYSNECLVFVKNDGTKLSYPKLNGCEYNIVIM